MGSKEAARRRGNCKRAKGSGRSHGLIVTQCAAFALALMAVPTLMALGKCWGVW